MGFICLNESFDFYLCFEFFFVMLCFNLSVVVSVIAFRVS